jgi:hypothetical protein
MLSQCPPAQYPKLENLIGGAGEKPKPAETFTPAESAANARAWGAWLRAGERRASKQKGSS